MKNILYWPRLSNGKRAPLILPIKLYRLTNSICWPLEDDVSLWYYGLDRFIYIFGFFIFLIHNDAENRYLRGNFNNIDDLLTGMPTYIILVEIHIRAFRLGLRKEKFKNLLRKFYASIYIEESLHPKQYKIIQRQLWPVFFASFVYYSTMVVFTFIPIYLLSIGSREPLFKMIPFFEYKDSIYKYLPVMLGNIWVGIIVDTMVSADVTILASFMFHLNGRYVLMRQNFHDKTTQLLKKYDENTQIMARYRRLVIETLKENIRLNKFAEDLQEEYSFPIFIIFAFSAMMICAMGFKVYTSPVASFGYAVWIMGKIQETLCYGDLGFAVIFTTDDISSMYYESQWEAIIARSSDAAENIRLMKLIIVSMSTNRKPFNLTGLNFFSVSLTSVLTILQGAGSYFSCLIALR